MRHLGTLATLLWLAAAALGQQVVDRIVARVADDIITLSEVRELARYQELLEGHAADPEVLLTQLIEQWIVNTEATAARFPRPSATDVEQAMARLEKQFASPGAYHARLRELGLTASAVQRVVERQLYLARYLDYRFRPAVQVDSVQIEEYYRTQLAPQLEVRGQQVPPLEKVEEQIRELLTEREINERAARWLEEMRKRLKVERVEGGHAP